MHSEFQSSLHGDLPNGPAGQAFSRVGLIAGMSMVAVTTECRSEGPGL